jgi:hypothetical protein
MTIVTPMVDVMHGIRDVEGHVEEASLLILASPVDIACPLQCCSLEKQLRTRRRQCSVKVLLQTTNNQYVEFSTPFFVEILMCKI